MGVLPEITFGFGMQLKVRSILFSAAAFDKFVGTGFHQLQMDARILFLKSRQHRRQDIGVQIMGPAQNETADVQAGKVAQLFGQLRFKVHDLLDLFDVDFSGIGQFQLAFYPE